MAPPPTSDRSRANRPGMVVAPASAAGRGIVVVPARRLLLADLEAFVARCSPDALRHRFHGAASPSWLRRELRRTAVPAPGRWTLAAWSEGAVRGLGTLAVGADGVAELAFLVEDDWHRRGVGRALARELVALAADHGIDEVVAYVQPDNARARNFFGALVPDARPRFVDGVVAVTIPVPRRHARAG